MAMITNYWIFDGITVLMVVVMTIYLYMTRKFNYWKKRGVFEITPMPFFGNFAESLLLNIYPGYIMKDLHQRTKGEPYVGFYSLDRPCLLIREPDVIKDILVKDFNYFCDRSTSPDSKDRLGSSSLPFLENPAWKILRSKLTPFFSSGKLKKMFDLMLKSANNLETYFESFGLEGEGQILDIRDIFGKLATDMIGSTAYGIEMNSLKDSNSEFRKMGKAIFDFTSSRSYDVLAVFFYPKIAHLTGISFFGKKPSVFLREAFWSTINHRIKSGQKRGDLIDLLIDFRESYRNDDMEGFDFDGDDLVAQAVIFFTAGFETTSNTMAFTLYELAMHPEIQDKLREEILDELDKSNGEITYDMVMSLPYLDMVVSEILRKYPVMPFIDRNTVKTYQMPNSELIIEKGTQIFISLFGMHSDPQYFPDPEKFDPERFNEENKCNIPAYAYMPFGKGPRMCIGPRMGFLQTKLGIIKTLCQYEVTLCEKTLIPMVLDPRASVTQPMNCELYLNVRKLKNN